MFLSEHSTPPSGNASSWQPYSTSGTFQLSSGQGAKQIYLRFKDAAQNISGFLTDNITFDNISPTANSLLINNGADNTTSSTVTLSFENVTGASHYFATDDASSPTPTATTQGWKLYPAHNSDNLTLTGTGNRVVRVWFRDEAGNISGSYSDNISWIVIEVSYSENFTAGTLSSSSSQCTSWKDFTASLTENYSSITIRGSLDPDGVTCTGASANTLCQALRSGQNSAILSCDGMSWIANGTYAGGELTSSSVPTNTGSCPTSGTYTVRPCINNKNWGGIGRTCGSNTQSLSVVCSQ